MGKIRARIDPVSGATSYNWYKNGVLHTLHHDVLAQISISNSTCDVQYDISVEAINSCGTSTQRHAYAYVPCNNLFMMSPNPAANSLSVSINQEKIQTGKDPGIDEIKVFDMQGNIKKYQKTNKAKTMTLNISDLIPGSYFIEITNGTYKERKPLLIQK